MLNSSQCLVLLVVVLPLVAVIPNLTPVAHFLPLMVVVMLPLPIPGVHLDAVIGQIPIPMNMILLRLLLLILHVLVLKMKSSSTPKK